MVPYRSEEWMGGYRAHLACTLGTPDDPLVYRVDGYERPDGTWMGHAVRIPHRKAVKMRRVIKVIRRTGFIHNSIHNMWKTPWLSQNLVDRIVGNRSTTTPPRVRVLLRSKCR